MKSLMRHVFVDALIVSVLCLFPTSLVAGELVYKYVDLAAEAIDIDDLGYVGVELNGSYRVHEKAFLKLRYAHAEATDFDVCRDDVMIGGGIMFQLQENLDLVTEAGVLFRAEERYSSDDTGFTLAGLVRYLTITDKVELSGGLVVESIWDNTELGVTLGAVYWVTDKMGIKAGFKGIGDYEAVFAGMRYALGH